MKKADIYSPKLNAKTKYTDKKVDAYLEKRYSYIQNKKITDSTAAAITTTTAITTTKFRQLLSADNSLSLHKHNTPLNYKPLPSERSSAA